MTLTRAFVVGAILLAALLAWSCAPGPNTLEKTGSKANSIPYSIIAGVNKAGGKTLGFKHGQHIDYNLPTLKQYDLANSVGHYGVCSRPIDGNARMTNLLLTMMHKMDVNVEKFADSIGPVSEVV